MKHNKPISQYTNEELRESWEACKKYYHENNPGMLKTVEEWGQFFSEDNGPTIEELLKNCVIYTLDLAQQIKKLHKYGWIELGDTHKQEINTIIGKIEKDSHFIATVYPIYEDFVSTPCEQENIFDAVLLYLEMIGRAEK